MNQSIHGAELCPKPDGSLAAHLSVEGRPVAVHLFERPRAPHAVLLCGPRKFEKTLPALARHFHAHGITALWTFADSQDVELAFGAALALARARGATRFAAVGCGLASSGVVEQLCRRDFDAVALLSPSPDVPVELLRALPLELFAGDDAAPIRSLHSRAWPGAGHVAFSGASEALSEVVNDLAAALVPSFRRSFGFRV